MLGIISRGVSYKSAEVISKLYRPYVRLHLEYFIQFWTPTNVKDAEILEGVQRRATKMIPSVRNLYKERLKRFGMFSLRRSRLRGDMIEAFKMIFGMDKINLGKLFCIDEDERTRKYSLFKNQKACKFKYWIEFFINYWNKLIDKVFNFKSLSTFKIKLDEFMIIKGEI